MATNTIDELLVGLGLQIDKQSFQQASSSLNELRTAGLQVAGVFGAGLGFKQLTVDAADATNAMSNVADRLQLSVPAVDAWGYAFRRAGGSAQDAVGALQTAQGLLDRLATGDSSAFNAAALWGLDSSSLQEAENGAQLLMRLQQQLQGMSGQNQRNILDALGLGGDATFSLMSGQRGPLRDLLSQAGQLRTITQEQIGAARDFTETFTDTTRVLQSLTDQITTEMLPGLTEGMQRFQRFIQENRDDITTFVAQGPEAYGGTLADRFMRWAGLGDGGGLLNRMGISFENDYFKTSDVSNSGSTSGVKDAAQRAMLSSNAALNGINPELIDAVGWQESRNQHRDASGRLTTSPAGARGAYQIMPATGRDPGYGVTPLQNDSEEEHRRFARDYLSALYKDFDGNMSATLAAYNAGPGTVKNLQAKYGDDWLNYAPEETQAYVPSVMGRYSGAGGGGMVQHNEFHFHSSPEENARETERIVREMSDQSQQDFRTPLR